MKTILNISKTVFLGLGAVIGAGFISGAELISFFGLKSFVPFLFLSVILFCLSFYIVLSVGRCFGGYEGVLQTVFKKNGSMRVFSVLSMFITFSAMLSVIDEITVFYALNKKIRIFSVLILAVLPIITKNGIKFLEKINLFISPLILFFVICILLSKRGFDFSVEKEKPIILIKSFLFVFSNAFLTMPVLCDSASKKSKSEIVISAVILSFLLCLLALFILASIKSADIKEKTVFPFAVGIEKRYFYLFKLLLFISVFTSVFLLFYPLYNFAYSLQKNIGVFMLCSFSYLFSRLGILNIIDYAYPLIGVIGLFVLIRCAVFLLSTKYKKAYKENNTEKGVIL